MVNWFVFVVTVKTFTMKGLDGVMVVRVLCMWIRRVRWGDNDGLRDYD